MEQPKIERVLRLMKMMTGNNNYTVEDMAERLGISYRSVYRYIETFKDSGFVVQRKDGGIYKLGKDSRYFKEISQLIHFTDEEAYIVNQLIEGLDNTNMLKQNLRKKLTAVYNCTSLADSVVEGKNAINVNRVIEAINDQKQVILRSYASSHTGVVRDRLVEPFGFTTNYVQIWCYEPESGLNKLFNTARVGSVEVLNDDWKFADKHHEGYIDILRPSRTRDLLCSAKMEASISSAKIADTLRRYRSLSTLPMRRRTSSTSSSRVLTTPICSSKTSAKSSRLSTTAPRLQIALWRAKMLSMLIA